MSDHESSQEPEPSAEIVPANPSAPVNAGISENTMGMLAHLSSLSVVVFPLGIVLGPLLVWILKKDEMPFVDRHGKEAINFGISVTIYLTVSAILCLVLVGFLLLPLVGIFAIVMPIIAGLKANEGKEYEYPLIFRFVK